MDEVRSSGIATLLAGEMTGTRRTTNMSPICAAEGRHRRTIDPIVRQGSIHRPTEYSEALIFLAASMSLSCS